MRVLIVDDEAAARHRLAIMLAELDVEVVGEAENGLEALKLVRDRQPSVILLDITMPDMDGLSALKEIRAFDSDARVAMVTAMGQQSIVMEALQAGAMDFVVKPFNAERVLAAIEKLVA